MKQITPETKARIFSCYWGCEYVNKHGIESTIGGHAFMSEVIEGKSHLLVKPLPSITDEDAIEVLALTGRKSYKTDLATVIGRLKSIGDVEISKWDYFPIGVWDYLRSKYYALPAFGYSVDELVEAGVFKLKEVNND